jgi:hypothetical protein
MLHWEVLHGPHMYIGEHPLPQTFQKCSPIEFWAPQAKFFQRVFEDFCLFLHLGKFCTNLKKLRGPRKWSGGPHVARGALVGNPCPRSFNSMLLGLLAHLLILKRKAYYSLSRNFIRQNCIKQLHMNQLSLKIVWHSSCGICSSPRATLSLASSVNIIDPDLFHLLHSLVATVVWRKIHFVNMFSPSIVYLYCYWLQ